MNDCHPHTFDMEHLDPAHLGSPNGSVRPLKTIQGLNVERTHYNRMRDSDDLTHKTAVNFPNSKALSVVRPG